MCYHIHLNNDSALNGSCHNPAKPKIVRRRATLDSVKDEMHRFLHRNGHQPHGCRELLEAIADEIEWTRDVRNSNARLAYNEEDIPGNLAEVRRWTRALKLVDKAIKTLATPCRERKPSVKDEDAVVVEISAHRGKARASVARLKLAA